MQWGVVSGCHVNHSGSQSLSITAVCCRNDTQPDFNITRAEWHLTQVYVRVRVCVSMRVIVCASLCMYIILCVIIFSFPPLPCSESHRDARPWPCVWKCVCLCLCVCLCAHPTVILSFLTQSISSSNHSHLYFLFSPYISYLQSWKPRAADMKGIFIIPPVLQPRYFFLSSIYCHFSGLRRL